MKKQCEGESNHNDQEKTKSKTDWSERTAVCKCESDKRERR